MFSLSRRPRFGYRADFDVPGHGPGKHRPFDLPADPAKIGDFVPVIDAAHILLDDRTCVEAVRHVVGGDANRFHTIG